MSPKIVSSGAIVVNLAAYIAVGLFNEGSKSLLFYLNSIGVSCGHNAHEYADKIDEARIALAENVSKATPNFRFASGIVGGRTSVCTRNR